MYYVFLFSLIGGIGAKLLALVVGASTQPIGATGTISLSELVTFTGVLLGGMFGLGIDFYPMFKF